MRRWLIGVFVLLTICNAVPAHAAESLEQQSDEANLDVLDRSFAAQQTRLFETDKRRSRQVTLDKAGGLNFANPMQQTAGLVAPQL